jgi:uncharacterized membrane protein
MAPLIVQVIAWAVCYGLGAFGVLPVAATAVGAMRLALAAMFTFTAVSHFAPSVRADMIRMVPAALPSPAVLVSLTGLLELAGAAGLLWGPVVRAAALALATLLLLMFPANVQAARTGARVAGRPAMALRYRLPLQLFWISCLAWVAASRP